MKKQIKYNNTGIRRLAGISMLAALVFSSCVQEEDPELNSSGTGYVYVGADVTGHAMTRAEEDLPPIREGQITEGLYYLSYPVGSETYNVGTVNFDEIIDNSTGLPAHNGWGLAHSLASPYPGLIWNNINGSNPTFYMDNVPPPASKQNTTLNFDISSSSFKAGLYTRSNDLLWGSQRVAKNADNFTVTLHHAMAMVRVEITVAEGDYQDIDLSEATVELTNIVKEPYMFDRLTGIVTVKDEPEYENLMMVDYGETGNSESENIEWDSTIPNDQSDLHTTTYTTKDFILPPQGAQDGENRPKVKVTMYDKLEKKDRVFSAYLPYAMELYNSDGSTYLQSLSFLRDHILIIRCQLSNEEPRLIFFPVTVVDWIDVGHYKFFGHQVGIYVYDQIQELIDAYNKYVEGTAQQYVLLYPFGYRSNQTDWVFLIEQSLTIPYENLYGKMPVSNAFDFKFSLGENILTVTGVPTGGSLTLRGDEGAIVLKNIVTGNYR